MSTLTELSKIEDPSERARQAHGFVLRGREALEEARRIRDAAVKDWRSAGATQREIAEELRVSPGLIGLVDSEKEQASMFGHRGKGDLLFGEDGAVKLPKFTGLAIGMAADKGGPLTWQPTKERAQAVADAVREQVEQRGYGMELHESPTGLTWAVYVIKEAS